MEMSGHTIKREKDWWKGAQWTGIEVQESKVPERDQQSYKRNQTMY
jgi:hypothetical protein